MQLSGEILLPAYRMVRMYK